MALVISSLLSNDVFARERSERLYFESSTPEKQSENGEEKNDLMMCHYDVREKRRRVCEREEEEGGAFVVHG